MADQKARSGSERSWYWSRRKGSVLLTTWVLAVLQCRHGVQAQWLSSRGQPPPLREAEVSPSGRLRGMSGGKGGEGGGGALRGEVLNNRLGPLVASANLGWYASIDGNWSRQSIVDLNAMYHISYFHGLDDDDVIQIEGEFPRARFFSFQTYNTLVDYNQATRNAIQTRIREAFTLSDTAITASEGSNPYWDPDACGDKSNRFRVHLTKRGRRGLENEMAAVADDVEGPVGTVLMMRIYLPEDKDSPHYIWGGVEAPVIRRLDKKTGQYEALRNVPTPATMLELASTIGYYDTRLKSDHETECNVPYLPGGRNEKTHARGLFIYRGPPYDTLSGAQSPPLPSAVTTYMLYCQTATSFGENVVYVIEGKLPRHPNKLFEAPRVSQRSDYDVRYLSFCLGDSSPPSATYHTVTDVDITHHYTSLYGEEGWDRTYRLVFSKDLQTMRRCGLVNEPRDLTAFYQRDGLIFPRSPSVVIREMMPRSMLENGNQQTMHQAKTTCATMEAGQSDACYRPEFLQGVMGPYYPRLSAFVCPEGQTEAKPMPWNHHYER